jgi:nitroimidazol reductase NimA-like FMN-containing flavoprotein (pyridoxamine 5'-phosphate oxidase superfamily)
MRRKDKLITDNTIIQDILCSSLICRIAFFDKDYPYILPMNYGYSDNTLYLHGAKEGRKIDLLQKNNKVGFEITHSHQIIKKEESCDWTTAYRSIVGTGKMEIITDFDEKKKGLDIIMQQHGKMENSYKENVVNRVSVFRIHIHELSAKQSGKYEPNT